LLEPSRLLIRATNWIGDAVMCLPALAALRRRFPGAHIALLAKPWVADLYRRESFAAEILTSELPSFRRGGYLRAVRERQRCAREVREKGFDTALLLTNSLDSALIPWLAGIPRRVGYARDIRGPLLTHPIPVPPPGEPRRHESYYYLELLRRAGWLEEEPPAEPLIRLEAAPLARAEGLRLFAGEGIHKPVIGVSPGAAYGAAKRWRPERFAEAAAILARELGAFVCLHGSAAERGLCETVRALIAGRGVEAGNYAGATSLAQFIDRAAAAVLFLTNDSGAMHVASALGVPTVAVFGPTDDTATGPASPAARVVRRPVECSPCLLRECPIDHRCMTGVTAAEVVAAALELLQKK
jgi:heptosyltransferase-2